MGGSHCGPRTAQVQKPETRRTDARIKAKRGRQQSDNTQANVAVGVLLLLLLLLSSSSSSSSAATGGRTRTELRPSESGRREL